MKNEQESQIPFHDYQCFLFDLDGTLADSMLIHNQAWIETLKSFHCDITADILNEYAGVPNLKIVEIFNQRFGWTLDKNSVVQKKDFIFEQSLSMIKPILPVLDIALNYSGQKPMAIVSGGTQALVAKTLSALKIESLFPVRVCADDVKNGKPDPESFLLAAQRLGAKPTACLVFEDGEAGIRGALAAGMDVVKVHADFTYSHLKNNLIF